MIEFTLRYVATAVLSVAPTLYEQVAVAKDVIEDEIVQTPEFKFKVIVFPPVASKLIGSEKVTVRGMVVPALYEPLIVAVVTDEIVEA